MKPKIGSIEIERFRAFRGLRINGLGRVNLITGRNNTGKSSVLEALRILASDASPAVFSDIFRYREENTGEPEEQGRPIDTEGLFQFSTLFNGFPQFSQSTEPIVISTNGGQRPMKLTLRTQWVCEERKPDGTMKFVLRQQADLFGEPEGSLPALLVEIGGSTRLWTLDYLRSVSFRARSFRSEPGDESRMACVFVSPYGGERTATLGALWDKIARIGP